MDEKSAYRRCVKLRVADNLEFLNDELRVSRYSCTVRHYVAVLKRSDNESCRLQQRDHVRRRSCAAMAPQWSMQTSIGELVRLGKKLWWYSSKMAIKSVHDTASLSRKLRAIKVLERSFLKPRPEATGVIFDRGVKRGEIDQNLDRELVLDLIYGPAVYRMMVGHAPLDRKMADRIVSTLFGGLEMAGIRGKTAQKHSVSRRKGK